LKVIISRNVHESADLVNSQVRVVAEDRDGRRCSMVVQRSEYDSAANKWGEWESKAQALMPVGWEPCMLNAGRVAEALLSTVAPVDLDVVPVGQVFGLVTDIAKDFIVQAAQAKSKAHDAEVASQQARSELTKLKELVGMQMVTLTMAAIAAATEAQSASLSSPVSAHWAIELLLSAVQSYVDREAAKGHKVPPVKPITDLITQLAASQWKYEK